MYANIGFIYFVLYCLKSLDEIYKNSIRYKQDNYIFFSVPSFATYIIMYYYAGRLSTPFYVWFYMLSHNNHSMYSHLFVNTLLTFDYHTKLCKLYTSAYIIQGVTEITD